MNEGGQNFGLGCDFGGGTGKIGGDSSTYSTVPSANYTPPWEKFLASLLQVGIAFALLTY